MSKQIIIVGAGIAGLTAAVYLQRSGFSVTLIEQHSIVGGMCTSWKRKGYLFEGAVHWLTGSSPKTEIHQVWKDSGALHDSTPVFLHDPFRSVEWEGKTLHLYRDIDKTANQLLETSPEDAKQIQRFVKDVKALAKMSMPVFDVKGVKAENPKKMGPGFMIEALPALPAMNKLRKITCKEYVDQFQHPGIRRLLSALPDAYTATSLIFTLATLHAGDGGYPEGGSLGMVKRMEKTFTDLGGKLRLKTKVQKVVMANGAVTGVQLENETLTADAVVVTQETVAACNRLFDTPLQEGWLNEIKANTKPAVCTFISMGIKHEFGTGHTIPEWKLATPIICAGKPEHEISFNCYSWKEGFAPQGGSALTTIFMGDSYDFWKKAKDKGQYDEEKQKLATQIEQAIIEKFPQASGKIEVIDIATPLTYERYTGAYHGSWMSIMSPGDKMTNYEGMVESVKGLYFAGHRLSPPGGLPAAAASGRTAAQLVCRQWGATFK